MKAGLQSEFYLCLARAFLAPQDAAACEAFKRYLAGDLADLNDALDYPIVTELAELQHELESVPDQCTLLAIYSQLFLNPGSRIPINTGVYFDGAVMGGTVARIEDCYRAAGMEKAESFRDLADHVAVQLEFVASQYARLAGGGAAVAEDGGAPTQAADFLHVFVAAWAPRLVAAMEEAAPKLALGANPWLPLAHIVAIAAELDAGDASHVYAGQRRETAIDKARAKRASVAIDEEDMLEIQRKLEARGLATGHLRVPVEDRDAALGMTSGVPPAPRRKA